MSGQGQRAQVHQMELQIAVQQHRNVEDLPLNGFNPFWYILKLL